MTLVSIPWPLLVGPGPWIYIGINEHIVCRALPLLLHAEYTSTGMCSKSTFNRTFNFKLHIWNNSIDTRCPKTHFPSVSFRPNLGCFKIVWEFKINVNATNPD